MCLQITLWLQGLFLFSLVWTVGGTVTGDSRKKFDVYFRTLLSGTDPDHPKPKTVKITKVSIGSLHGIIYKQACLNVTQGQSNSYTLIKK